MLLQPADGLEDQEIVQQRPGLLDQHFADGPIVVALLVGVAQHLLGDVDGAAGAADVEGLVLARVVEDQKRRPPDQRDAEIVVEQGVDEVGRELAHGAVEELDDVVAGVEAG